MLDLNNIYVVEKNGLEYAMKKLEDTRNDLRNMEHDAVILETACYNYIQKIETYRKTVEKSINTVNLMLKVLKHNH